MRTHRARFVGVGRVSGQDSVVELFGYNQVHHVAIDTHVHFDEHRAKRGKALQLGDVERSVEHVAPEQGLELGVALHEAIDELWIGQNGERHHRHVRTVALFRLTAPVSKDRLRIVEEHDRARGQLAA